MFMKNHIAVHATDVIQHGVFNGVHAWRNFYRDQLPLADDKRDLAMAECMRLKEPATATALRHLMLENRAAHGHVGASLEQTVR